MSPDYVLRNDVWVVEVDGEIAGFYGLIRRGDTCELDHLWLLPRHIGTGLGRLLFEHAAQRARDAGAIRMEWEAEEHALGFYERMGGRCVRTTTSELGRPIDVMELRLA